MQTIAYPKTVSSDYSAVLRLSATAAIAVAFFLVYFLSYPRDRSARPVFTSPRENIGYLLSRRAAEGNGFSLSIAHYDELPPDVQLALTPRDAAARAGKVLPRDFAGTMLLHALLSAISPWSVLIVSPIFGVASAWVASRIGASVFGRDLSPLSFAFLLTLPPLWINSAYVFMGDSAALFFTLLAILFLVSYWETRRWQDLVLVSAATSLSVLFRYPNALFLPLFAGSLIVGGRFNPRHVALAALAGVPTVVTMLAFNWLVYGAPTTTGFAIGSQVLAETANIAGESFVKVRPEILWMYVQDYGIRFGPGLVHVHVLLLPVLIGLVYSAWMVLTGSSIQRFLAGLSLGIFLVLGFYYGNQDAWGLGETWVNASVLRYLLPALILVAVFFYHGVLNVCRSFGLLVQCSGMLVVVALMVGNAQHTYEGAGGVRSNHETVDTFRTIRSEVLAETEPDAIIATRLLDKILFPDRPTLTLTYALNNAEPVSKGDHQTWELVPGPQRFAEVAAVIVERGIPFYLIPDRFVSPLEDYDEALKVRGLRLVRVSDVESQRASDSDSPAEKDTSPAGLTRVSSASLYKIEALSGTD